MHKVLDLTRVSATLSLAPTTVFLGDDANKANSQGQPCFNTSMSEPRSGAHVSRALTLENECAVNCAAARQTLQLAVRLSTCSHEKPSTL